METVDHLVLDDELWEELLALTDGEVTPCFQCGVCTASCPWGLVRGETFSVRKLIRKAQLGVVDEQEELWLCTTCSQCEPYCPRGVHIVEVIQALRYLMWKRRTTLEGLPSLLWSVYWNNNPWFQPPSQRAQWAVTLDLPDYDPDQHDVLLYVGCTASYDRRAQNLAHSLIQIFRALKVPYGVLGEKEPCCGEMVLRLGHLTYFMEIAEAGAKIFRERRVGKLVAISPHCYDVFLNHYPEVNESFKPFHYTEYLASILDWDELPFQTSFDRKVTYHDPCFLGRRNQHYEAPRKVMENIPGLTLVEMENYGPEGLCCGGGGGRMWMETDPNERFSDLRVQEAASTGASVIATACPYCITYLEDSIKSLHIEGLEVLDIAEIAAEVLPR